jgi:hypothetical protein
MEKIMPTSEETNLQAERYKSRMEGDFHVPDIAPAIDQRMVNAAEFSAFQLGQINQSLKKLVEILGATQPKPPKPR